MTKLKPLTACQLLGAVLAVALAAAPAFAQTKKPSPLNGAWELKVGGDTYRIEFSEEDGDVRGTVTLPNGESASVEYGLLLGKDLEFLTVEQGVEHEWTATVGKNSIQGQRINLDTERAVGFTAKRSR